jgi:hypothetical protein
MEQASPLPEHFSALVEALPALQSAVTKLFIHECRRNNVPETEVQCVVDVSNDDIACARIEPDAVPLIRLSAVWCLNNILSGTSDNISECIRRCVLIAHRQLRWTLGKNKPRNALDYVEKARRFRLVAARDFSLPVTDFRTTLTVTMRDPITGTTLTREDVPARQLEQVQKELAHQLTAAMYADEQIASLMDTLHAVKLAREEPSPVKSVAVTLVSADYVIQSLTYEDAR